MLPLAEYADLETMEDAARAEGLAATPEDQARLNKLFGQEMYTRELMDRIVGHLRTHRYAGRSDLYRRFRGDNHKDVFNDVMLRLLSSGHVRIEKTKTEGARGRKVETLIWGDEKIDGVAPVLKPVIQLLEALKQQQKDVSAQQIAPPQIAQTNTTDTQDLATAQPTSVTAQLDEKGDVPQPVFVFPDVEVSDDLRSSEQTCYPANPEGRACKNIGESNDGSAGKQEKGSVLSGLDPSLKTDEGADASIVNPTVAAPKSAPKNLTDKRFDW